MNNQHNTGVIEAAGTRIGSLESGVIAEVFGELPEGNARRLAACWNLCHGVSTEQIEAIGEGWLVAALGKE